METVFGTVTYSRRLYQDRHTQTHVYLLDQLLSFDGNQKLSPHLEEVAVRMAVEGPSYRSSAEQLEAFVGYKVLSHEAIRERVLDLGAVPKAEVPEKKSPARILFVEMDGLYVKLQR